jgi:hypothetical protein
LPWHPLCAACHSGISCCLRSCAAVLCKNVRCAVCNCADCAHGIPVGCFTTASGAALCGCSHADPAQQLVWAIR